MMEDKFARIKTALNNTSFKQLNFSEQMKNRVKQQIELEENAADLDLAILQLLVKEKTGYELVHLLQARGINVIKDNEGMLYTNLHVLEKERLLVSNWSQGIKSYRLSEKGKRVLNRLEKEQAEKGHPFKKLIEG
jgi:DNA-binding PadR family transcriptional regulator